VGAKVEAPEEETKPVEPAVVRKSEEGGEESIDDYMSRLMQRVRSTAGEAEVKAPASQVSELPHGTHETPAACAGAESPKPSDVQPPMPVAEPRTPASASPRAVAPEKRIDLRALRDLANLAAQSAISHHAQGVLRHTMYSKLVIASAAMVMGGGLLWMWKHYGAREMAFYAAVVAFFVGVYWGVEYMFLTRRITAGARRHREGNDASKHEQPVPSAETGETAGGLEEQKDD
jgi:hypothetical protein